jgi:hypothetical protein
MPLPAVELRCGWLVEQAIIAPFTHLARSFPPTCPGLPLRADDDCTLPDLDFDLLLQARLFDHWLGETDAARIADADES